MKIFRIFSDMRQREKVLVTVLAALFLVSLGHFFYGRIPVRTEKGVFAEGMVGRIKNLNPLFVDFNDADRDLSELIFSGLIRYDPVAKNFFPDVAEKLEPSRDGLVYTAKIRNDVFWHDGERLTTDDVYFTFHDVILDPGFRNPILKNAFEGIRIEKTGTNTVVFTLPKPNSYFPSQLTTGILPRHLLLNAAIASLDKNPFGQHPVGSGPYILNALQLGSDSDYADLEAFPKYYGLAPRTAHIRFFTFPSEKKLLKEYSALTAIGKISSASDSAERLRSDPRFTLAPYILNQFTALSPNSDHPILKEKKVRQALAMALNKDALVMAGEKRIDSLYLEANPENPAFSFQLENAGKMLDGLGWKKGEDGIRRNSKNEKFSLTLFTMTKIKDIPERIQQDWKALGIEVTIEKADGNDFSARVSERQYGVLLFRQNLGYNRDVYPLFHSSQISREGLNFGNFRSFRTDGLTEAIRKEKNSGDKEKLLKELNKVITEEVPLIFLSTPVYFYALPAGTEAFPTGSLDFHADRLSVLSNLTNLL